ncbi:MAG: hypothetical protein U0939_15130 [Pirellulales bacterium]
MNMPVRCLSPMLLVGAVVGVVALLLVPEGRCQAPEPQVRALEGHRGPAAAVGFTPDGKLLVSAGHDGTLRAWDRATGLPTAVIAVGDAGPAAANEPAAAKTPSPVLSLAVAPSGLSVAAATRDGVVRRFDLGRSAPVVEWGGVPGQTTALLSSPDGKLLFTADSAGVARAWDPQTKNAVRDFASNAGPLVAVDFDEAASLVMSLTADGVLKAAKLADGQPHSQLLASPAVGAMLSEDRASVLTAGQDGWLRRLHWPPVAPQAIGSHGDAASTIVMAPNGQWFASGGHDQQVHLFQASDGKLLHTLREGPGKITSLAASADSTHIIAGGEQGQLRVWRTTDGQPVAALAGAPGPLRALAAHPREARFATAGSEAIVRLWSLPTPNGVYGGTQSPALRSLVSPDGKTLWTLHADRAARSWQTHDGKQLKTIGNLPENPTVFALSADQQTILVGDAAGAISAYSLSNGAFLHKWGAHQGPVAALVREPNGPALLSAGADGVVKIWSEFPEPPRSLATSLQPTPLIAGSADGRTLVAAQNDGMVVALDPALNKVQHRWPSPTRAAVTAVAVSADGATAWAADAAGQVRAWQLKSGALLSQFGAAGDGPTSLAVQRQGKWAATTHADGEVRLWNLAVSEETLRDAEDPAAAEPKPVGDAPRPTLASSADGLSAAAATPQGKIDWRVLADGRVVRGGIALAARPRTLTLRPDGGELAAGDESGDVHLFAQGDGAAEAHWRAHEGPVTATHYHPGGSQLATAGGDGLVRVWQLPTLEPQTLAATGQPIVAYSLTYDGARLYTAAPDKRLAAFDLATGERFMHTEAHQADVTAATPSFDNSLVATADAAGGISIRSTMDGRFAFRIRAHAAAARGIAFPRGAAAWVSVGDDGVLRVWEYPQTPRVFTGHQGAVDQVSLAPNGQSAASVGADKTVRLWNLGDGSASWTLAHDKPIRTLAWRADSQSLATLDAAHSVRVWNLADGQQTAVVESPTPVAAIAWTADGRLVLGQADGVVRLWNVAEKKETAQWPTGAPLVAVQPLDAVQQVLTGHADGTLKTWQLADQKPLASIATGGAWSQIAVTRDGKRALLAGGDKALRQAALDGGAAGPRIGDLPADVRGVTWSVDGQRFAASLADGTVRVWTAAGEAVEQFDVGATKPTGLAFNADGKGVIVGAEDGEVRVIRLLALRKIQVSNQPLTCVVLGNDNVTAVVGGRDRQVTLWNVVTGAAVRTLGGAGDAITAVETSPDGAKIYAASLDKQVRSWNFADGQPLTTYAQPSAALGVSASRDGQKLAVTTADGLVRVHDVATGRVWQVWMLPGQKEAAPPIVQFGRDNQSLLAPRPSGELQRAPLSVIAAIPAHPVGPVQMAWSPNGQHFATYGVDRLAKVYDLQGRVVVPLAGGELDLVAIALRRDGGQGAALTRDQHLITWNVGNGQQERKLPLPPTAPGAPPATHLTYSLDQTKLLVAGGGHYHALSLATGKWIESGRLSNLDPVVALAPLAPPAARPQACDWTLVDARGRWRRLSLKLERSLTGHAGAATRCIFTPDGAGLVTAGVDKTVRLWSLENGAAVRGYGGATDAVHSLAVSGDGQRLAAVGADKTVRVWNLADGQPVANVTTPVPLRHAVAAHDGLRFFVLGDEPLVRLFDFASGREVRSWALPSPLVGLGAWGPAACLAMGNDARLQPLSDAATRVWTADAGKLHVAAWLPYGKQLVTCGDDRVVKLWNRDGTLVKSLSGHPFVPTSIAVRADGLQVALAGQLGSQSNHISRWRLTDGQLLPPINTAGHVAARWLGPNRLAVACVDQRVRLYQVDPPLLLEEIALPGNPSDVTSTATEDRWFAALQNGQAIGGQPACQRAFTAHDALVTGVAYVDAKHWLLTASADKTIRVWDDASGTLLAVCTGSPVGVQAMAVSADGRRLAAACDDNQLRLWSLEKAPSHAPEEPVAPAASAAAPVQIPLVGSWPVPAATWNVRWNSAATRLLSAHDDGVVRLWQVAVDPATAAGEWGQELQRWSGHGPGRTAADFGPLPNQIATAGADKQVVRQTILGLEAVKAHAGGVVELRWSPDRRTLVTSGVDKQLVVWDARSLKKTQTLGGLAGVAKSVTLAGDGQTVFAAEENQVRGWNAADGKTLSPTPLPAPATAMTASRDGARLFVATADLAIRPWAIERTAAGVALRALPELKGPGAAAVKLTMSDDDRWLVSAHADQGLRVWLAPSGRAIQIWRDAQGPVYALAFTANGEQLAAAGGDRRIRTYDVRDGRLLATSPAGDGPTQAIQSLAFAPNGQELASASAEASVQLWDAQLRPRERLTAGVAGRPRSVVYSPDGGQLFLAGDARGWQQFQRSDLARVKHVDAHTDAVVRAALNPAGNRIATLDRQGHWALWDAGSGALLFHQQLPSRPTLDLAYAPDGVEVAVAAADGRVLRVAIPPPVR